MREEDMVDDATAGDSSGLITLHRGKQAVRRGRPGRRPHRQQHNITENDHLNPAVCAQARLRTRASERVSLRLIISRPV